MTTTAATGSTPALAVRKSGDYIVLKKLSLPANASTGPPQGWEVVGGYQAVNAAAAIRKHAEKATAGQATVLVAVPAKSWKPVKVTATTETKLHIEAA